MKLLRVPLPDGLECAARLKVVGSAYFFLAFDEGLHDTPMSDTWLSWVRSNVPYGL